MNVDAALDRASRSAVGQVEELLPRKHLACMLAKGQKHIELGARRRYPHALRTEEAPFGGKDPPTGKAEGPKSLARARPRKSRAAQQRTDARDELTRIEGLGDVIVGPDLESHDAVDLLSKSRQHEDRQIRGLPKTAADAETVFTRQHNVEHHKVDRFSGQSAVHLSGGIGAGDDETILAQSFGKHAMNDRVILDDEDMRTAVGGDEGQGGGPDSRKDGRSLCPGVAALASRGTLFFVAERRFGVGAAARPILQGFRRKRRESLATILNMTTLDLSGIPGLAISIPDATGAPQAASSFDRPQSIARRETRRSKQGHNFMRRLIYTACVAVAIAMSLPVAQSFADDDGPSAERQEQWKQTREQRLQQQVQILDARLVGFKASLSLTSDQEKNWAPFEAALRNAARPREPRMRPDGDQARNEGRPSPVDIMRRFSQRLGERSIELSALADSTTPLYASLDDKQKLVFGATLRGFLRPRPFGPGRAGPWRFDRRG